VTESLRILDVDRLNCRLIAHDWAFDRDIDGKIDRWWREQTARNPRLYDGVILLASRVEARLDQAGGKVLEVDFFEARFSRYYAWRTFGSVDRSVFNCFAMPAVRSADGAFLLGEMAEGHSNEGQVYFPCGTPDREDVRGDSVDLLGSLVRELAEETGIRIVGDVAPSWRIVFAGQQIACVKIIDLPWPAQALQDAVQRHIRAERAPELAKAHMFSRRADLAHPRLLRFVAAFLERELTQ
jgi:8-oxo-dGTP pyrophosphatase MutT (NUDIX family)